MTLEDRQKLKEQLIAQIETGSILVVMEQASGIGREIWHESDHLFNSFLYANGVEK